MTARLGRTGLPAEPEARRPAKRWSTRPGSFDRRDDRGQLAGIEVLPFGVLIFVVGALLITNAWAVVDAKIAVDAASREAVRTYVEAPDAETALEQARRVAADTVAAHGRRPELLTIQVDHDGGRPFARCVRVTIEADYPVPALRLPWIGGFGHAFDVQARHSERIDPYRSGLPGDATC
ncbi:MAG: hypothetical protein ACXWB2_08195 [Acidimicrobiales bacterium]